MAARAIGADEQKEIIAREYQKQILEIAYSHNVIV